MLKQFRFHSKDDSDSKKFETDSNYKRQSISAKEQAMINKVCGKSYRALNNAPGNLFPNSIS